MFMMLKVMKIMVMCVWTVITDSDSDEALSHDCVEDDDNDNAFSGYVLYLNMLHF